MKIRIRYPVDIQQTDARTVEFTMPSIVLEAPCLSREATEYLSHHLGEEELCRLEERCYDMMTREVVISKLVVQMRG